MLSGKIAVAILIAVLATAALIYLTPLKWVNIVEPKTRDIDPREFQALLKENPDKYVFVDVRDATIYKTSHAQGSISMPIGTLYDGHISLPRTDKQIVLICSSGRLAGVAYGFLERQGFQNLLRVKDGVQGWVLADLPLEGTNIDAPLPTID